MKNNSLRILLVGNGGREHALAWKLSQSTLVEIIFVVPGNGGTARGLLKVKNIPQVRPNDFQGLVIFARAQDVNLVIPGPEAPLVDGIEGVFRAAGIRCFGPSKAAARMEGSKTFSKDFMNRHNIPTARYKNFNDYDTARQHIEDAPYNLVIKASGLAAGKGVIIPSSKSEAETALRDIMLRKDFGSAGDEVVIEEYLEGEELSFLSFSDGYTIRSLPPAQDHKQVFNEDKGPNTGGMGCYAPTKIASQELVAEVHRTILQPTIDGMRKEAFPFAGMLFTGLMITDDGPKALEYNVRFGDPETQTLLPLLSQDTDLAEVMIACTEHWLDAVSLASNPGYSATVVATARGYPGKYERDLAISLGSISADTTIFHAGTAVDLDSGKLTSTGGRVIAATSTAPTLEEAISRAYAGISSIKFSNMHFRTDIGHRAINSTNKLPRSQNNKSLTYASAGVSISSGNSLVRQITPLVASTARPGTNAAIGGFGGLFDLVQAGYTSPPKLIGAIDGVGTKLKIAQSINKHDTIGIDLVAMNVNDLVVQGAEPLFFLDCYSCGKLDVSVATDFVKGVSFACKEAGCALVGGETAEMPDFFASPGHYDAVGATVGAVENGRRLLPDKASMKAGDIVLGLASSGCHSNGFSLVRKIVETKGLTYTSSAPWDPHLNVSESLLTPTKIYVKPLLRAVKKDLIKGMAHITGGGLLENIPRMLPDHLAAKIHASTWTVPEVMKWLKAAGRLEDREFARVFNTGLGMVLVVAQEHVEMTVGELEDAGETVWEVGKVVVREDDGEGCVLEGVEAWRWD